MLQTVSHTNISKVGHVTAANTKPVGRDSEPNRIELRDRSSAPAMPCTVAGLRRGVKPRSDW